MTSKRSWDYLYKIIIIGDVYCGKSTLLGQFCDEGFEKSYIATIGLDFKVRNVQVDDKKIRLNIWDTGGCERFKTMTKQYYRNADIALLVYDVTNRESFENIVNWMEDLKKNINKPVVTAIVGNKIDLIKEVQTSELKELSSKFHCKYYETSAKLNVGVDMLFRDITADVVEQVNNTILHNAGVTNSFKLTDKKDDKTDENKKNSFCSWC